MVDEEKASTIAELKAQRGVTKASITRIKNIVEQKATITATELQCRLSILEAYFKQFLTYQNAIERLLLNDEDQQKQRGDIEDLYCTTKSKILSMMTERRPSVPALDHSSIATYTPIVNHLPKIKLPHFAGKYSDFPLFFKTFDILVNKESNLSTIEKFNYLLSCLSGAALRTIKAIDVTEENYEKALKALKDRYDNRILIFQEHIQELFNLPKVSKNSPTQLRSLIDNINAHISALLTIGSYEDIVNSFVIQLVCARLDPDTLTKWEESIDYDEPLKWETCAGVLAKRCQFLESRDTKVNSEIGQNRAGKSKSNSDVSRFASFATSEIFCKICNKAGHKIYKCEKFRNLSVLDRYKEVKKLALCLNCLSKGHSVKNCTSSKCRVCNNSHHTLLHRFAQESTHNSALAEDVSRHDSGSDAVDSAVSAGKSFKACIEPSNTASIQKEHTFLATAVIQIRDSCGALHNARALLDSASQLNFISQELLQCLKLPKEKVHSCISGIGETSIGVKYKARANIVSRLTGFQADLEFWTLTSITNVQPEYNIDISAWAIPDNVTLADPYFYKPQRVELLIGADIFFEVLAVGQIRLGSGLPILQKTLFGWIVAGKCRTDYGKFAALVNVISERSEDDISSLHELVQRFWEMEDVATQSNVWSEEQAKCEDIFTQHIRQLESGHLMVKLPFKQPPQVLGDSITNAQKRLHALEKRLGKNVEIKEQYLDFLSEYLASNHMEKVSWDDVPKAHYFMPHQFVLRPDSSTTKLRVVFDASCRTSNQVSLNDILMVGPTIQDDLLSIILRFRCHKIGLTADIAAMYRQIFVYSEDTNVQCILWRSSPSEAMQPFKLKTVTYGTASAPFLATRCLKYLADKHQQQWPKAATIVRKDFYMDDLITGGNSLEEISLIRKQVDDILRFGQFTLRKWQSNNAEIMSGISEADRSKPLQINDANVTKTLGIIWNSLDDIFTFSYTPPAKQVNQVTKRRILSEISRLFDPLGIISPVIVKAKILLQELWLLNLNWDESIPFQLHQRWITWQCQLESLRLIQIPRCVINYQDFQELEIHGFSDASLRAYGCCIYVRCASSDGNASTRLYAAKSKVAPSRVVRSLPCLELCAAELLAKLWDKIRPHVLQTISRVYLWTDSVIVLDWLSSHPSSWKVFVANRVSSIQQLTEDAKWRYVSSKQNPADLVSRGADVQDMVNSIWFSGPQFLSKHPEYWPKRTVHRTSSTELPERRRQKKIALCVEQQTFLQDIYAISDFIKNCRRIAIVRRFYNNLQRKIANQVIDVGGITAAEIDQAFLRIVAAIQKVEFREEISQLERNNDVHASSQLKALNPFVDNTQEPSMLRVGGRLRLSHLPYAAKCPIILPKINPLVESYVRYLHLQNFHAGAQTLVTIIRQRFWVIGARDYARKIIRNCIHCFRYRPVLQQQIMGDLPHDRVVPAKPFVHAGVDFCGPIHTTHGLRGRAKYKSYIAIFICFTTKASHLEVVSDLTAEAFIAALKRFIGRRGLCARLYCDNATNFVGAQHQLDEFKKAFQEQAYQQKLLAWSATNSLEIRHIPPRSPHFGGIWESAVKLAKGHLYKTLQAVILTFEELTTVAVQIEAILNSRPLTPLSTDPSDEEALTPAHFLNQRALECIPEPEISYDKLSLLRRWQRLSAIQQHFWRRWSKEYLALLQQRNKWTKSSPNLEIGTLVIVQEDNLPPQKWLLGRIISVTTGPDNNVRVACIKTKNGTIRRAIHKLAVLPVQDN